MSENTEIVMGEKITEEWLAEAGFKYHQEDRQPKKHWVLWLGYGNDQGNSCIEDVGVELTMAWWLNRKDEKVGDINGWYCWIISHTGIRSIVHIRKLYIVDELTKLVEALTGQPWNAENHLYGNCYSSKSIERLQLLEAKP